MDSSMSWPDVGAASRNDFISRCRLDWDRTRAGLSTSDLGEAVMICRDGRQTLLTLRCDELRLLYAR